MRTGLTPAGNINLVVIKTVLYSIKTVEAAASIFIYKSIQKPESYDLEDVFKNPLVVLLALAAVGISTLVNTQLATNPQAVRPDPFTGTEGRAIEARVYELEKWRNEHTSWGRERAGRWDAQIEQLMKHHERHHPGE